LKSDRLDVITLAPHERAVQCNLQIEVQVAQFPAPEAVIKLDPA
jgi:hypothetical protein